MARMGLKAQSGKREAQGARREAQSGKREAQGAGRLALTGLRDYGTTSNKRKQTAKYAEYAEKWDSSAGTGSPLISAFQHFTISAFQFFFFPSPLSRPALRSSLFALRSPLSPLFHLPSSGTILLHVQKKQPGTVRPAARRAESNW